MALQLAPQIRPRTFRSPVAMNGMGAAEGCSIWGPAFAGAVALYLVPPLLGGFFSGVKQGASEAWSDRKRFRRKRR